MKSIEKTRKLFTIVELSRKRATGTPAQLAQKLDISERTLFRYVDTLKACGIEINYYPKLKSYVSKTKVNFVQLLDILASQTLGVVNS